MSGNDFLSKEEILGLDDSIFEDVVVPEWGHKKVRVLGMTGAQRDAFEAGITSIRQSGLSYNLVNVRAGLLARTLAGPDNKLLFKESDIAALGQKSAAALDRLFSVAQRLSGIGKKDIEDLAENFPAARNGASISA